MAGRHVVGSGDLNIDNFLEVQHKVFVIIVFLLSSQNHQTGERGIGSEGLGFGAPI